jgi:hypothetical protein
MKFRLRSLLRHAAMIGLLVLIAGCGGKSPTTTQLLSANIEVNPAPASGDAAHPVILTAKARNTGLKTAWYSSECLVGPGIGLQVFGPDGDEVLIRDPYAPVVACADGYVPLQPGRSVQLVFEFTGLLYTRSYEPSERTYAAPPGTYTAVASFGFADQPGMRQLVIESRVTFEWGP